jgi:16S rRNA (cytosine1402-N4)-methyltransferase
MEIIHVPVMREEILEALKIKSTGVYVDATLGLGGHSEGILQQAENCTLIGIDRDDRAIAIAEERLSRFRNVHLVRDSFSNMRDVVHDLGYKSVSGIILDAGVSTLHLKDESAGFSFLSDEPLDMRMDRSQKLTAREVVNRYPEKDLAAILYEYGEEWRSRRIARAIDYARKKQPINTCKELADIIQKSIGRHGRIQPATKTFQAIRIEVNKELEELSAGIDAGTELLEPDGRFCVLSYHSLEDRIVKNAFKKLAKDGIFRIITKKPLVPRKQEQKINPSSRSAKFRVGERI